MEAFFFTKLALFDCEKVVLQSCYLQFFFFSLWTSKEPSTPQTNSRQRKEPSCELGAAKETKKGRRNRANADFKTLAISNYLRARRSQMITFLPCTRFAPFASGELALKVRHSKSNFFFARFRFALAPEQPYS
jgi:hypothetical protein